MKEVIEVLKKLQTIDKDIFDLGEEQTSIPLQISEVDEKVKLQKTKLNEADEALKKAKLQVCTKEGNIKDKEVLVSKYDAQFSQVKTNKEYTALQKEIATLKADISLIEEDVIEMLDSLQVVEKSVADEKSILDNLQNEYSAKKNELELKVEENQREIESLNAQRGVLVEKVDPVIYSRYETLVKNRNGVGISKIEGERCSQCRISLRAQTINEVMKLDEPIFCESCSRILYI